MVPTHDVGDGIASSDCIRGMIQMGNVLLVALLACGAGPFEARMVDGATTTGKLVGLTPESVVLAMDDVRHRVEISQLITLTNQATSSTDTGSGSVRVQLIDGSVLRGTRFMMEQDAGSCQLDGGQNVSIPPDAVRYVRWTVSGRQIEPRNNSQLQKQWDRILNADSAADIIVIRKERERNGRVVVSLDYLEGILRNVSDDVVQFEFDGQVHHVTRHGKVEGLIYYHPAGGLAKDAICELHHKTGSLLRTTSLRMHSDQLALETASGVVWTLPLDDVRRIDFSKGKIVYLSDMDPESVQWTPYVPVGPKSNLIAQLYRPRRDRNFDGNPLALRGEFGVQSYSKGLAIHSRTLLRYRIPTGFHRFRATAGMDATIASGGHVRLDISGDGQLLFRHDITDESLPRNIDIDIRGLRHLEILVDFGEDLDIADHLNLCEARVTK